METDIIDPVTGLKIKHKVVEILPKRMNHAAKHTAAKLRDEVLENSENRIGPDGIVQLFPDKAGLDNEWYMPVGLGVNPITDGKYYRTEYNNEVVNYTNKYNTT